MSDIKPNPVPGPPLFTRPAPGYFATKRILKRLSRFQNVIRHKERWATDIDIACPIEELVDPKIPMHERFRVLNHEIRRTMQIVYWDINYTGVPTGVIHKHWDIVEQKDINQQFDVIIDYFRLPRDPNGARAYEAVMSTLEQAIGVYEARLRQAKREMFNPIVWVAHLIRIPITVMERAGLVGHEKTNEIVIGAYAKIMKYVMLVIIVFVAIKLGVSIPWKDVVMRALEFLK